ncbi:MAG TPA: hypothetical protein VF382_07105, partial [Actinomycetota bacterium]
MLGVLSEEGLMRGVRGPALQRGEYPRGPGCDLSRGCGLRVSFSSAPQPKRSFTVKKGLEIAQDAILRPIEEIAAE